MLLMFRVENYTSFRDEIVLDLRKSTLREHENHVLEIGDYKLLKTIAIYGANASGKSNLVCAISDFKRYILSQLYDENNDEKDVFNKNVQFVPFLLSDKTNDNVEFEIVFYHKEILYQYGFSINGNEINSEWLYINNKIFFDRNKETLKFGDFYKKKLEKSRKYRDDRLYLSILDYYNTDENINHLIGGFKEYLGTRLNVFSELYFESAVKGRAGSYRIYNELESNIEFRERVTEYVKKIDVGIDGIEIEHVIERNPDTGEEKERPVLKMIHKVYDEKGNDKDNKSFDLRMESSGTNRFLSYIQEILKLLDHGGVFVVDELSSRLHPLLTKFIIDLFQSKTNKKNAQLVFTTHEVTILNKDQFRRDEVVLVDKDYTGNSRLRTLASLNIRKDASFSKDYLNGKYGAIPIFDYHFNEEGESNG